LQVEVSNIDETTTAEVRLEAVLMPIKSRYTPRVKLCVLDEDDVQWRIETSACHYGCTTTLSGLEKFAERQLV
jgi:hypothetical protein